MSEPDEQMPYLKITLRCRSRLTMAVRAATGNSAWHAARAPTLIDNSTYAVAANSHLLGLASGLGPHTRA